MIKFELKKPKKNKEKCISYKMHVDSIEYLMLGGVEFCWLTNCMNYVHKVP